MDVQEELEEEEAAMIEFIIESTNYTESDLLKKPEVEFFKILSRARERQEQRIKAIKEGNKQK